MIRSRCARVRGAFSYEGMVTRKPLTSWNRISLIMPLVFSQTQVLICHLVPRGRTSDCRVSWHNAAKGVLILASAHSEIASSTCTLRSQPAPMPSMMVRRYASAY